MQHKAYSYKYKKNIVSLSTALIIVLLFNIFFSIMTLTTINRDSEMCYGNIMKYTVENISQISGYTVIGNSFEINSSDPQLLFADINKQIGTIKINFKRDESIQNYNAEVYFARQGEHFSEKQVIRSSGTDYILINLPQDVYQNIRIDVNTKAFVIDSFEFGSENIPMDFVFNYQFNVLISFSIFVAAFVISNRMLDKDDSIKSFCLTWLKGSILAFIYFMLLFKNRNLFFFASDEGEAILNGIMVANGYELYTDVVTQHTPLMYYLCALYSKIGALGVINFRLLFYLTLSVFWVWMYFRYSKVFGKIALGIWPVLYIFSMRLYDGFEHCMLADQLQAQGMVVLLLEYLLYVKNKRLDIKNMLCISFAVFLAVGNAFVAVFAIFIIVLGFTTHEVVAIFKERNSTNFKTTLKKHLLQYCQLVVICLCPFIILFGVYLVKGCLYDAYYGIYLINRVYYPIYISGYGSSIVGTMIGCFDMYFSYVINAVSNFSNLNYYTVFLIITMFATVTYGLIKKQYIAVVVIFCFTVFCGSRGYVHFHALPYYAVCLMLFSLLVQLIFYKIYNKKIKAMTKYKLILTVGLLIITFPFAYLHFDNLAEYKISKQELLFGPKTNLEKQIADLTVPGDEIYFCALDTGVLINTQTFPATASPVCPWIYDAYKEKIFNDLETKKPNVIYYFPNYSVWGYKLNEFAPELSEYINTKYKLIDENIYIRK